MRLVVWVHPMAQHEELRSLIDRIRRRWFAQVALRTTGRAMAVAAVPALASLAVYALLAPEGKLLVALAIGTLLASCGAAAIVLWQMQRRPDDRHVARFIEERADALPEIGSLDDALVTAVDAAVAEDADAGFRPLLVSAAVRRLREIEPERIVPVTVIRRAALECAGGAAALAIAVVLARAPLTRAVQTAWTSLFPASIELSVLPGDVRVVAGAPLRIRAVVRVGGNALTEIAPALTVSAGAEQRTVAMSPDGEGFLFAFESVDRSFRYTIAAGSAVSQEYTVSALFPPRVARIDLRYDYPSFTGLAARDEQDAGDIYAPAGTRVRVRIHTDKPIASGQMSMGGTRGVALRAAGERLLEADLVLARDDSYRVRLADTDGLSSDGDTEYFIRVMDDRPPDVRILRPAGDQQITPLEEVAIEARADDDYGISRFELVYAVAGGQARTVPFTRVQGTDVAKVGAHLLAAEELRVQPGDVITYYARARDVGRGKRPTETKSDIFFLEVRPFNEEFVAAQSQAMSGASGAQVESLIAAQKEIITATWNIERRTGAGRSAEDLKAVAQAQAELKARAEQMSARGARRPSFVPRQQIEPQRGRPGRQSGPDPIAAAIDAMARAVEQLEGQRTREAIPHEMAALQGLLRAQAEVRRRQVMQQQANGASNGGSGRQGQDLSALFDKELQRQQRTNYETRSQVEERPDQRDSNSALDRIHDLARRQEDLSRRQRELAAQNLSAEELKRQLERLTREQSELREQLEELSRDMGRQNEQSARANEQQQGQRQQGQRRQEQAQGQQPQPGGQAAGQSREGGQSQAMREASEQMRSAASDLRRQDATSAAESGSRAADELRRLEQQMRGNDADARQRAAGELQLEAQQIADEQRRIAGEASRLDKGEGTGADAWRRLAGEKDKLADRVDELQRNASALGRQGNSPSEKGEEDRSGAAADAARTLEQGQVGRRMRDGAQQMRGRDENAPGDPRPGQPQPPRPGAADAEQQIARTLDRVVEQLGGANPGAKGLSEQLDQTRGIRERLDRLERQMRDAEAREKSAAGAGRQAQPGNDGREGSRGREGSSGSGQGGELQRLREDYARELQRARETLGRLQGTPRDSLGGSTPEQHEWSQSAPGNEAFKQDFARWESLRKDVDSAIERHERAVSEQIAKKNARDRLSAGGSDRVPDAYRALIARYYESLARVKKQ